MKLFSDIARDAVALLNYDQLLRILCRTDGRNWLSARVFMHFGTMVGVCLAAALLIGAPVLAQQSETATTAEPDSTAAPDAEGAPTSAATVATDPPPAATSKPASGMDGSTYAVRLRDLQQRIDQLKEQIRRSHTRLSLLSDTILTGGSSGSRSAVRFENKLSSQFKLTRLLVVLDGAVQYNKKDRSGVLSDQQVIPIFSGSIPPGDHTLQVLVNLRGHGYGVFSYLRGYRFEVRSSHSFTAVEGKTSRLRILAYEKGGVTTPLEERPAIRYLERVVAGLVDAGGQPAK